MPDTSDTTPIVRPTPTTAWRGEDLKAKPLPNFTPSGDASAVKALEQTLADLNKVGHQTQAPPTAAPGEYSAPCGPSGLTMIGVDPATEGQPASAPSQAQQQPATAPAPVAQVAPQGKEVPPLPNFGTEPVAPKRIFFTGRSGMGASWLAGQIPGARIIDLQNLIGLALEVAQQATGSVVITGVDSPAVYKLLSEAGYEPWHITASNGTWAKRPKRDGAKNDMAAHLDQQAAAKTKEAGEPVRVIWNDPTTPLPPRFWSVQNFLAQV